MTLTYTIPAPVITITKTDNGGGSSVTDTTGTAVPGDSITYSVVVANSGPSDATATVSDPLSAALTSDTWSAVGSGGATATTTSGTGAVSSDSVTLPAGSSLTFTITGTISSSATGTLSNTASVTPSGGSAITATDTDDLVTHLEFTTDPPPSAAPGSSFSVGVSAEDSSGHVVTSYGGGSVTLAITPSAGTAGATLSCPHNPTTFVSGVANFNCSIDLSGSSYTLTAGSSGLTSATSSSLDITSLCPSATVSCQSEASTTPGGSATASNDGVSATASGGEGILSVGQYASDPDGNLLGGAGEYLDVSLSSGDTFTSLTIDDCNLNGGTTLEWWNGGAWQTAIGTPNPPGQAYSPGSPACVSLTLSDSTSPNLSQLVGTVFASATPPNVPGAPSGLSATAGNAQSSFTWSAPSSDGGAAITSYTLTCTPYGVVTTGVTSATITGLANGTAYTCAVDATNAAGTGAPSPSATVTPMPSVVPPPPSQPSNPCVAYTGNGAFICSAYEDLLGRVPDAGGLAFWNMALSDGISRAQVAYDIATSTECRIDLVNNSYQLFLDRSAEAPGFLFWVNQLARGVSDQSMLADILGSSEFYADSGSSSAGFMNALYHDLLGRTPDAGGLAFWESALGLGVSRSQVAQSFLSSHEYWSEFVEAQYARLLGRPADSGGLSFWVSLLQGGASHETVISGIIGSAEFLVHVTGT